MIFFSLTAVTELNNLWNEFCCKFIVSQAGCNFTNSSLKLLSRKNVVDRIVHLEIFFFLPASSHLIYFQNRACLIFIQNLICEKEVRINISGIAFAHYCWILEVVNKLLKIFIKTEIALNSQCCGAAAIVFWNPQFADGEQKIGGVKVMMLLGREKSHSNHFKFYFFSETMANYYSPKSYPIQNKYKENRGGNL